MACSTMLPASRRCSKCARDAAAAPTRPRRSMLFLTTTGEEEELLGADYYARHPRVPIGQIVGDVDLDKPLLTCSQYKDVVAIGANHPAARWSQRRWRRCTIRTARRTRCPSKACYAHGPRTSCPGVRGLLDGSRTRHKAVRIRSAATRRGRRCRRRSIGRGRMRRGDAGRAMANARSPPCTLRGRLPQDTSRLQAARDGTSRHASRQITPILRDEHDQRERL